MHRIVVFTRRMTVVLLLFASVLQTFSSTVVIVDFYINQDTIAQTLCINRYRPELLCCGKCQLTKRLRQDNKESHDSEKRSESRVSNVLSSRSFYLTSFILFRREVRQEYALLRVDKTVDQPSRHFHPPGWRC